MSVTGFRRTIGPNASSRATRRKMLKSGKESNGSAKNSSKTPIMSRNVTVTVTTKSRPQNRAEQIQSRAEQTPARTQDPKHWEEVQDFLKQPDSLTDWEVDFLHSVKWKPSLTELQRESLKGIRDKLRSTTNGGCILPSVKRGTPAYDAWIAHYRKTKGKATFYEKLDALTVPSEFPPQEQAA